MFLSTIQLLVEKLTRLRVVQRL